MPWEKSQDTHFCAQIQCIESIIFKKNEPGVKLWAVYQKLIHVIMITVDNIRYVLIVFGRKLDN